LASWSLSPITVAPDLTGCGVRWVREALLRAAGPG